MIWWALLLFVSGLVLIVAEVVIPGGVLGVMGALALLGSTALGIYAAPDHVFLVVLSELLGGIAGVAVGLHLISSTKLGSSLRLSLNQNVEDGWVDTPNDPALMGAVGEVLNPLRPAGTIDVAGRRIDAVSDGTFVTAGARVRVIEVHGNRIVVEPVDLEEQGTA